MRPSPAPAWGIAARRRLDEARSRLPPGVEPLIGRWATVWPLLAVPALVWLTWPISDLVPGIGLDPSWQAALHLAADRGVHFGPDLDFTYGPLGFLAIPKLYVGWTFLLSLAWNLLLQVALVATVLAAARRALSAPVAIGAAYVLGVLLFDRAEAPAVLVFAWSCMAVEGRLGPRMARVAVPLGGVVIGLLVLVKINVAVVCVILALIAAPFAPPRGWRALGLLAGSLLATVALAWVATGNVISDLPLWLGRSAEIAVGYQQGLDLEALGRGWEYPAFGVMAGLLFALIVWHARRLGRARGGALTAMLLVLGFLYWKHGFVRHYTQAVMTFAVLASVPLAIAWRGWTRIAAVALLGVGLGIAFRSWGVQPGTALDPTSGAGRFDDQVSLAVHPGERRHQERSAVADARRRLEVNPRTLAELRGHTVHVWPYETSAIWAFDLRWRPLPIFQNYVAYTTALDRANAERLASQGAPSRILLDHPQPLDNHLGPWESPAANVALICNYRQQSFRGRWAVLAKVRDRCGTPRRLKAFTARAGETIQVPPGMLDELVVMRVSFGQTLAQRARALFFKPAAGPGLSIDDSPPFRLLLATAGNRAPLVVAAGPSVGFSPETGVVVQAHTLRFAYVNSPFRGEFDAIPVAAASVAP